MMTSLNLPRAFLNLSRALSSVSGIHPERVSNWHGSAWNSTGCSLWSTLSAVSKTPSTAITESPTMSASGRESFLANALVALTESAPMPTLMQLNTAMPERKLVL